MPFTLHVRQALAYPGIVTQASAGLPLTPHPSAVPPAPLSASLASTGLFIPPQFLVLLRWPCRPLSRLRSSLQLRLGLRLPPPTRLCLLRTCATHAWLRGPLRFRPMPDDPPLAFRPVYRPKSNYLLFCISLGFRLALLSILGHPLALPMVVGPPRALMLFLRPRLALTLLCWPSSTHSSAGPRVPFAAPEPRPV